MTFTTLTPTQYMVSAALTGGFAWYIRKNHPYWAAFFALGAISSAVYAFGKSTP